MNSLVDATFFSQPAPTPKADPYAGFFKSKTERKAFDKQLRALWHAVTTDSGLDFETVFAPFRHHALLPQVLADVSFCGSPLLVAAADANFAEAVRALIGAGADTEATGTRGMTALMLACDHGGIECARILAPVSNVRKQAMPWDDRGATALHLAAAEGHAEIIALIATEDSGRARMARGMTPLMALAAPFETASKSSWRGHIDAARALLPFSDAFARMDDSDAMRGGHTALMVAIDENRNWGPLHEVILAGMIEQEKGARRAGDTDCSGWRERHLVDICLSRGEEQQFAAKALLDAGADPLGGALSTSKAPTEHQPFWIALHTHLVPTAAFMARALEQQNRHPREERQAFFLEAVNYAIAGGALDMADVLAPFCDLTGAQLRAGLSARLRWQHADGFLTQWAARWESLQLLAATQGHENADALISRAPQSTGMSPATIPDEHAAAICEKSVSPASRRQPPSRRL